MNFFQDFTQMFTKNQFINGALKAKDYLAVGIDKGNRPGSIIKYPEVKIVTMKKIKDFTDQPLKDVLVVGNVTGGTNIFHSAGDNSVFTTSSKILMGESDTPSNNTTGNLEIFHSGNKGTILNNKGDLLVNNNQEGGAIHFSIDTAGGASGLESYFQIDGASGQSIFYKNAQAKSSVKVLFGGNDNMFIQHTGESGSGFISNTTGSLDINSTTGKLLLNSGIQIDIGNNSGLLYTLPLADGTASQFIKTDGSGNLFFGDILTSDIQPFEGLTENFVPIQGSDKLVDSPLKNEVVSNGFNKMTFTNMDRLVIDKPSSHTGGDPEYLITQDGTQKAAFGWDDEDPSNSDNGFAFLYNYSGRGIRIGSSGSDVYPMIEILTDAGNSNTEARVDIHRKIKFVDYGSGSYTGTAAKLLAVDTGGNVIEEDVSTYAAQNLFSTIAVTGTAGQSNIEADTTTDTLTFDAGTGISLTTQSNADVLNITNSAPNVDQNLYQKIAIQNSNGTTSIGATNTTDTFTIKEGTAISLNEDVSNQLVSVGVNEAELPVTRGMSSTINYYGISTNNDRYDIKIHITNKTSGSPNENDTTVGPQNIYFKRQNSTKTNQGGMPWNLFFNQYSPALDPGYDAILGFSSQTSGARVMLEESVKDILVSQGSGSALNSSWQIASFDIGQLKSFRMPLRMRVDNGGSSPGNGTLGLRLIKSSNDAPDATADKTILPSTVYVYFRDTTLTSSKMGGPPFNLLWAGSDTTFAKFQNSGEAYTAGCDYVFTSNAGDTSRKYELFFQDEMESLGRFSHLNITDGRVVMQDLPTSDPVSKGVLWNDNGTLKISAG